jgi:hypothetical protein
LRGPIGLTLSHDAIAEFPNNPFRIPLACRRTVVPANGGPRLGVPISTASGVVTATFVSPSGALDTKALRLVYSFDPNAPVPIDNVAVSTGRVIVSGSFAFAPLLRDTFATFPWNVKSRIVADAIMGNIRQHRPAMAAPPLIGDKPYSV